MSQLKFNKMWEAADAYVVFQIDHGSILPMLETVPRSGSFVDQHWLYYFDGKIGGAYYESGEMQKAGESGLKDFQDPEYQKRYFDGIKKTLEQIAEFANFLEEQNTTKLEIADLRKIFEQAIRLEKDIFGYYLLCQQQCMAEIEALAKQLIAEQVSQDQVDHIFSLLSTSTKLTKIRQEELDWLDLLLAKDNMDIEQHYKKYHLLNEADGQKAWTRGYYKEKFNKDRLLPAESLVSKKQEISRATESVLFEQKEIIKKYSLHEDSINFCQLLAEIGHARLEMRLSGWMPMMYYLDILLTEIARRFGYTFDQLKFAHVSEIIDLFDDIKITEQDLNERQAAFLFVIDQGEAFLYQGEQAKLKFKELVETIDYSKMTEVSGNIAMKGKVTGSVVVFRWSDNMEEKLASMTEDSILVTGQTRPQLMPLISKSKAIVTDEGGITSHAAIVSRELRIPCIIGTKFATLVFKDGDRVEVDADKGIVRIIN